MPDEPIAIYCSKLLPKHWIIVKDQQTWCVPAVPNGWERRTPIYVPVDFLDRIELPESVQEIRQELAA